MLSRFFFLVSSLVASAFAHSTPLPPKEKFHLFLLVGQSNMAGRGVVAAPDKFPTRAC